MTRGRTVAIVVGCLLLLPAMAMLLAGGVLTAVYATQRDDAGYFSTSLHRISSPTGVITSRDIDLNSHRDRLRDVLDVLDVNLRLRVSEPGGRAVFVGIAPTARVNRYLAGVAHDEIFEWRDGRPRYRHVSGTRDAARPASQSFWAESATGPGTRTVRWDVTSGRWTVVVMNANARADVVADAEVGARAGFVLPLALSLLGAGLLLAAGGIVLIVIGASRRTDATTVEDTRPAVLPDGAVTPVRLDAELDADLSRWQWLVKWFLAIPHWIILAFLWVAFFVLTVVAFFAILFTGRYPRAIFDFNRGVLRWSWRVSYYASSGGLGTDRYPPFSLGPEPDYPARLEIAEPGPLSRGLVLVKWWLLAIPHYIVVAILVGGGVGRGRNVLFGSPGGLIGILVLIAVVILLVRNRYPQPLFDLIIGLHRWVMRVVAYAALMTDAYPPFRLDQGGRDPAGEPSATPTPDALVTPPPPPVAGPTV